MESADDPHTRVRPRFEFLSRHLSAPGPRVLPIAATRFPRARGWRRVQRVQARSGTAGDPIIKRCTNCFLDFEERVHLIVQIDSAPEFADAEIRVH